MNKTNASHKLKSSATEWKLWLTTGLSVVFTITWVMLQKPVQATDNSVSLNEQTVSLPVVTPTITTTSANTRSRAEVPSTEQRTMTTQQPPAAATSTPATVASVRRIARPSSTRRVTTQTPRIRTRSS